MSWFLEPEEAIGRQWHRLVGSAASWPRHPEAAVPLDRVRGRLAVMFRALGGAGAVQISAAGATVSHHRLGLKARLGLGGGERLELPRFDGATLQLPVALEVLPTADGNEALYEWLAVWFALAPGPAEPLADPLQADVLHLRMARLHTAGLMGRLPGLRPLHARLAADLLANRPRRRLSGREAAVEAAVRAMLGEALNPPAAELLDDAVPLTGLRAPCGYHPFLPVPLWGEIAVPPASERRLSAAEQEGGDTAAADSRRRRARRRQDDQTRRRDPLVLNRFETILGVAEMMNLNRAVEDDDVAGAKQAAEDLEEIAVGQHERRAATRLKLELDLPPEAAATEPLPATRTTYPEWDYGRRAYHRNHCQVIAEPAVEEGEDWWPDEETRRRIRQVRRQFEALRPRRQVLHGQPDGDELDLSAVVRALADRRAGAPGSDRLYSAARSNQRDLAVAVLVDVSLSTDSWVEDRRVLDVEKEALLALSEGLEACGDEHAILAFTSQRRSSVSVRTVKDFGERLDARVLRRVSALKPGHYTRMGAAVRHAAHLLSERPHGHRLLLLLTDGKPNDADHYEGRYGVEDTRMAIREARRAGHKVFGITVDRQARDYFPYLFGPGAYAIFPHPARLPSALPAIYRQITS